MLDLAATLTLPVDTLMASMMRMNVLSMYRHLVDRVGRDHEHDRWIQNSTIIDHSWSPS